MKRKSFEKFLTAFLLIIGILIFINGIINIFTVAECKSWPSTNGRIIDSSCIEISDLPENKTHDAFIANVVFEYWVNNQTYFSNTISYFGPKNYRTNTSYYTGSYEEIKNLLKDFYIDKEVEVFYNPDKPGTAVLEKSLKVPVFLPVILGILLIYCAFHCCIYGISFPVTRTNTGS